jgi:D-tyrosyl-tRNA(Tyr) deacylase
VRALIQRVVKARVTVRGNSIGAIGSGLVVMLGIARDDNEDDARYLADKIVNLRIFPDQKSSFSQSAVEVKADLLLISQFTLFASTRKGKRPSFSAAESVDKAKPLYEKALGIFKSSGLKVETGRFQEEMLVEIQNNGPMTLMLDSHDRHEPRR